MFISHTSPKKSPDFDQNRLFPHTTSPGLSRLAARSTYLESASQVFDCTMDDCGVSPVNSATDVLFDAGVRFRHLFLSRPIVRLLTGARAGLTLLSERL
jgi:hypothetical protein